MKTTLAIAMALAFGTAAHAVNLALWNFNDSNTAADGGVNAGTSSLGLVGSPTASFAAGSPNDLGSPNNAYSLTSYPTQGTGSGTRGWSAAVSTVGYSNVMVSFDVRNSNTGSRYFSFAYTLDGGANYVDYAVVDVNVGSVYQSKSFDLSSITGANNNANFGFKVTAIFAPGTSAYAASNATSSYGTSGTSRYDLVSVDAQPVPEPASMLAIASGIGLLAARRRNKR